MFYGTWNRIFVQDTGTSMLHGTIMGMQIVAHSIQTDIVHRVQTVSALDLCNATATGYHLPHSCVPLATIERRSSSHHGCPILAIE